MHGLMPPHPGPVAAVAALGADTGKLLGWGFLIGIPTAAVAGPLFARLAVRKLHVEPPVLASGHGEDHPLPSFGVTLFIVCLPIGLMLMATAAELTMAPESSLRSVLTSVGHPVYALVISVLVAALVF